MASATHHETEMAGKSGERLREHARAVQRESQALAGEAREAMNALRSLAREQVEARPYGVLGAAFGLGWLLGGGLPLRAVVFVGGVGARLAAQELLRTLRPDGSGAGAEMAGGGGAPGEMAGL